ncbi:MAG: ketopantoate reductase family protein [Eubacteriaceae bacterium]|nr:ketopantoate reductase family protein [Eubacteriaceae bacterium]
MKKIAFVGAGAIGSIVAAFLAKGGADVILVDPFKEHMDQIATKGLVVNYPNGDKETVKMKTAYSAEGLGVMDIVIVLTKTTVTDEAIKGAKELIGPNTFVGTFQNGLGNPEKLAQYIPEEKIFYGCLNVSSRILQPGEVLGNVFGECHIFAGSKIKSAEQEEAQQYLTEAFAKGGVVYRYDDEADLHVWTKALLNISGNAPQALVRLKPSIVAEDENYFILLGLIVDEVCAVAKAKGIEGLDGDKFMQTLRAVYTSDLAHHWSSTAQDMLITKRQTEIETLNGAIAKYGEELGVATPYNKMVYLLTRVIEDHYADQYQENATK